MKRISSMIVIITVSFLFAAAASAATLIIADFDSGDKPNNIKGDFGTWNRDEADPTQGCKMNFNNEILHNAKGFCLQFDYDVDSPNPAYNGFWMNLEAQNLSQYDKLTFWVKGDEKAGFSSKIKIELKNSKGEVGKYTLTGITKDWQQVSIPVKQFAGLADLTSMKEFVVVFDDITCAGNKKGTIYIDDIAFVK
jgi:hypothetical protein